MIVAWWEVPSVKTESARVLRPKVIRLGLTNGTRSQRFANLFGAVQSVVGTGYLNGRSPAEANADSLDGKTICS